MLLVDPICGTFFGKDALIRGYSDAQVWLGPGQGKPKLKPGDTATTLLHTTPSFPTHELAKGFPKIVGNFWRFLIRRTSFSGPKLGSPFRETTGPL